ncbi:WD40 domain-containing protein [cyanobacterium endosymbiont of Epithemia clementina EcSB]|uniref:WD40 domain-containing protein n=1 Tax=cyanobacterium endosymbiont of Epithemia clementina EcSB TaxID=3034674 RepID=UPI0024814447|nr:AAA-like domain-containing protein [cyanobacterium endosymbiont of Epithemia clementina EcSB]WGT67843.1 AAA-like domain-containing protein [cyanobacterium endosymbiont of Epithemia clementina EcSB]
MTNKNVYFQKKYKYKIGGSLSFDHPTYGERAADKDLLEALRAGKFCYIFNCRQMGKSSLRVRMMHQLQAEGMTCASVDITSLGSDISQQQWYSGIITQLFLGFNLTEKVNLKNWLKERQDLSGVQKFILFLEEVLLVYSQGEKKYIFIDEIDKIISLDFSLDDFFTLIRFCYNQRAEKPQFNKIVFALFGVATPSDLIRDKTQTPFNIGQPIELTGFTLEEVYPLVSGLTIITNFPKKVLKVVLDWTGGQPFLTQKLCQLLLNKADIIYPGKEEEIITNIVQKFIIKNWESQDEPVHLKTIRDRLLLNEKRTGKLLGLYQKILNNGSIEADDSPEKTELRLSGLVVKCNSKLIVYNKIYREVFNQKWVSKELEKIRPYSEAITAWINSNYQDTSRLLRGKALEDALYWAIDKNLSNIDYQFLTASQNLDKQQAEINLVAEKKANEILTKANQKAQKMIRFGVAILVFSLVGAIIFFTQARLAIKKQQEAQKGTQLEQAGNSAWRRFRFEQIEGLLSAMEGVRQLQTIVRYKRTLQDYPATSPILALEQILDLIHEKNKLTGHQDAVNSVSFSPNGQLIATSSSDGTIRLWDWQGRERLVITDHQGNIYRVAFSPDGQSIATASQDDTAKVWTLQGEKLATLKGHKSSVYSVSFSPNGKRLVTTSRDYTARVWDLQGRQLAILKGHQKSIDHGIFNPDGQRIATASRDGTVKVWDSQGNLLKTLKDDVNSFYSVSFSPDGQRLAASAKDGTVRIWDNQGKLILTLKGHQELVKNVTYSKDGKWIVTGSSDGTARVWNSHGEEVTVFHGHQDPIYDVAISNNGQKLATASSDGTVKLWDMTSPMTNGFKTINNYVTAVSFSSDSQLLAIAAENGNVYLWNLHGKQVRQFQAHNSGINNVKFSQNDQKLVTTDNNGRVKLWNLQGKLLSELFDNSVRVYSVTFSPDGQLLAIATRSGEVWLWNIEDTSPKLMNKFTAHNETIHHISFEPSAQRLATASGDGTAKLWDLQGNLQQSFLGHKDRVNWLNFSPDSQYLLTASKDKTARLWKVNGNLLEIFKSDLFPISHVNISPDNNYLATASSDGTIRLWDFEGNLHAKIKGYQQPIVGLKFSQDGRQIITVARNGIVKIWPVQEEFTRLKNLLTQGCQWLEDYFVTRPQEKVKLKVCE